MPGRHIYWREAVILSKQGRVVDDRPFTEVVVKVPVKTAYRYNGSKKDKFGNRCIY